MSKSIRELLDSPDPLTDEALETVLTSREETTLVDFKLDFHPTEEREWLEITKDVMAFANTFGGYLAFGVRDGTYEIVGLDEATIKTLRDPNHMMQKINRYVEPQITSLRSRPIDVNGKTCVLLLIPASRGQTHLVLKDAAFKFPSGVDKILLHQGTSYVRRSAGNHLVDARDLDAIISMRLDYFKSTLLDKIAKVVEAPAESKVLVVSEVPGDESHSKFVIDNASGALPVKGLSFTVSPATIEQEIAAWMAMTARDPEARPAPGTTWNWYRERKTLKLTAHQKIPTAIYGILSGTPVFFWLQNCKAADIKSALAAALSDNVSLDSADYILSLSTFLGKKFHRSQVSKLPESLARRLGDKALCFPPGGPRSGMRADSIIPKSPNLGTLAQARIELETDLDTIAASAKTSAGHQPQLIQRWFARRIDCYLYAQDDQYA
jgi:hypothetical protein